MGPRFFRVYTMWRPAVGNYGDVELSSSVGISGSVWDRRAKAVIGGQGEVFEVTAQGFFHKETDLKQRDLVLVNGRMLEVVRVVSGFDDRGRMSHVGAEFRDSDLPEPR